jgi:hypothetical protein
MHAVQHLAGSCPAPAQQLPRTALYAPLPYGAYHFKHQHMHTWHMVLHLNLLGAQQPPFCATHV